MAERWTRSIAPPDQRRIYNIAENRDPVIPAIRDVQAVAGIGGNPVRALKRLAVVPVGIEEVRLPDDGVGSLSHGEVSTGRLLEQENTVQPSRRPTDVRRW